MFYINQSTLQTYIHTTSSLKILKTILTIPPQQRTIQDVQYIYQFFYNNKILTEIERIKSYNSKQQCISHLLIDSKKPKFTIDFNSNIIGNFNINGSCYGIRESIIDGQKTKSKQNQDKLYNQVDIDKQKKQINNINGQNNNKQQVDRINKQVISKNTKKQPISNNISQQNKQNMIIIDRIIISQVQKQEQKQQKYYILLKQQKLQQILNTDQKYLRENIQILKKYTILSQMKYKQLLHLAYYMNQISYKYKQDVYKQGEQSDYLYLVQKGQFHYGKKFIDNSQKTHINNKNSNNSHSHNNHLQYRNNKMDKKKDRPKRYDAKYANPNRVKNSMSIQYKIGVIQGQSGQCFGEQQIIVQGKRQYNVTCMSTQNLLIRIPKNIYKKVISTSYTKMQWIKKQNKKKIGFKDQIFNKMIAVKSNYKKYTSLINQMQSNLHSNLNMTEKVRNNNNQYDQYTNKQIQHFIGNNRSMLPKIRSRSIGSQQQISVKRSQKSLNKSQIMQEQQKQNSKLIKKSQNSQITQQNEYQGTFDLTGIDYTRKRKQRKQQIMSVQKQVSVYVGGGTVNSNPMFPSINTEKQKTVSAHQTIQSNIVKNWSASRPMIELKGLRNKFSGMIDSNSLVKEKQQILNMNLLRNKNQREELYPLNLPEKVNQKIQIGGLLTKQQTRQMRSAAHSKAFMQKLLVEALRKAGYNSDKSGQQNYTSDTPNNVVDIKNNLRIPKSKPRTQKSNSQHLLEQNTFDQCFFKKM